jgi:hypothetical protein
MRKDYSNGNLTSQLWFRCGGRGLLAECKADNDAILKDPSLFRMLTTIRTPTTDRLGVFVPLGKSSSRRMNRASTAPGDTLAQTQGPCIRNCLPANDDDMKLASEIIGGGLAHTQDMSNAVIPYTPPAIKSKSMGRVSGVWNLARAMLDNFSNNEWPTTMKESAFAKPLQTDAICADSG